MANKITASIAKKGRDKRAAIADLTLRLAAKDNSSAKIITKTIKVRTVETANGKLKKSMAAYRNEAVKDLDANKIAANKKAKAEAGTKRATKRAATLKSAFDKGAKSVNCKK